MSMTQAPESEGIATLARSGFWLLSSRLIAMSVGLLGLPILMSALGPMQFGAWAVLLGGTFAFGTLELGMSSAVMRWTTLALMPEAKANGASDLSAIMSISLLCTALVFAAGGGLLFVFAEPLAAWLNLPPTPLLSPGQCILVVYGTVAVLALLRCTIAPLLAARRMATHSAFTLAQSVIGAAATWSMALVTQRLDLVLIANACSIIAVQLTGAIWTHRHLPWRFAPRALNRRLARDMLRYGSALQFSDLSNFVMYQFDKLIISGVVGPSEVAHYEVASRSAQALGNISTAPFVAFAPALIEHHGRSQDPIEDLLRMLRMTLLGVGIFLLLPLAVSQMALFAWVGQIGYHAAGVFALLTLSVISTALILPLSMCAQAMGRSSWELARAGCAMLINVPAAFLLIHAYGKEGAALGTLLACLIANTAFALWLLRKLDLRLMRVWQAMSPLLVPSIVVVIGTALAAQLALPLVVHSRWYMAPMATSLYAIGLLALLRWLARGHALESEESTLMRRVPLLGKLFAPA